VLNCREEQKRLEEAKIAAEEEEARLEAEKEAATIVIPRDYPTIQEALKAAGDDSRLKLEPGVYNEQLTLSHVVTISGTISEEEEKQSILQYDGGGHTIISTSPNVKLSGLIIQNVSGKADEASTTKKSPKRSASPTPGSPSNRAGSPVPLVTARKSVAVMASGGEPC